MALERQHRPIDKEFEECYYTGVLDISGRNLRLFPNISDELYDPLEVFTGIISGNRFDKFPKHVLNYLNIVTLTFHNNALRSIPADLTRLQQLKQLDLSRNFLQKLPSSICDIPLETLCISNNRLQELPHELGNMTTLKSLDVSCNDLTDLPDSFTELHGLIYLNLRRNEIGELPTDIFKVPLGYLNISSNVFTRLPISLRHLSTLTEFHCSDNPLDLPPAQVCVRGLNHVFKYLTEMEKYGSDPQLFATNREESLMRRRRDRGKRSVRPTSNTSTLSGDGSDYERSLLDEMNTFVKNAFGGKDGHPFLSKKDPEPTGGPNKQHWTQLRSYEENSPYRSKEFNKGGVRYRSQSPGPVPAHSTVQCQQTTPTHANSSGHYGTLPRSSKESTGNLPVNSGRGLIDEPVRSGSFHNYGSNRVSSPVSENRVLKPLSSENEVPTNPDLASHNDERSYLSKKTELPHSQNTSTPTQYHNSPYHTKHSSSSPKVASDDETPPTYLERSSSPANSRDGSITPTPEDVDTDEPLTPKKLPEELTISNVIRLLEAHEFSFSGKWDELGRELGVSLDDIQRISAQVHLSEDYQSAMGDIISKWLSSDSSWKQFLVALENCGQSSIVKSMKNNYLLLDEGLPSDMNLTPQHKSADKQVSFSVAVSEIPSNRRQSVSSEPEDLYQEEQEETELEYSRSVSCPTASTDPLKTEELEEEFEDRDSSYSPSPSPSHSPRKGPQPAPKPTKKKDIDSPTWPKKRSGGQPHKRKGDVFKSIGKQDPNFTVRRMEVHMMEELEKIQNVKKEVEEILSVTLSDDLGEDIGDGILLCQLVNKLHPNTISVIHMPKKGETITGPKRTMNIAAFIAACKKIRVPEASVCSAGDISEYKDPIRVCACIRGLLDTVSV